MLSFTTDAAQNVQPMRLRDDPPPITHPPRPSKKRKSPPTTAPQHQQQPQQPIQVLPPPHALMHPIPGQLPPGYPYAPSDYSPGGIPLGVPMQLPQQGQPPQPQSPQTAASRTLSNSKRAEQNRKAQRAFRERRDQHVKALESRSSLLDSALASADEANRRWEECRALVDQLRMENASLRALTQAAHPNLTNAAAASIAASIAPPPTTSNQEDHRPANDPLTDSKK